jgi:hypothetical protein
LAAERGEGGYEVYLEGEGKRGIVAGMRGWIDSIGGGRRGAEIGQSKGD